MFKYLLLLLLTLPLYSEKAVLEEIKSLLGKNPSDAELHYQLGSYYIERDQEGDYELALPYLEKSKALGMKTYLLYKNLGLAYYELEDFDKSKEAFEFALAILPKDPDAINYNRMAIAGKFIQKNKNSNKGRLILARAYYNLGMFEEARNEFALLIKENPADKNLLIESENTEKCINAEALKARGEREEKLNNYKGALSNYEDSIRIFQEISYSGQVSVLHYQKGNLFLKLGKIKDAEKSFNEALKLDELRYDTGGKIDTLNSLGSVYLKKGEFSRAIESINKSIELSTLIGDKKQKAGSLNQMSIVYSTKGNYKEAIKFSENSSALFKEIGDIFGNASALNNLGIIHKNLGNFSLSLKFYEESLKIKKKSKNAGPIASTYENIANLYAQNGNFPKAHEYYDRSLKIKQEIKSPASLAISYYNKGTVYESVGNYSEAEKFYKMSLDIRVESKQKEAIASSYLSLGNLYELKGNLKKALKLIDKALLIYTKSDNLGKKSEALKKKGDILFKKGEFSKAKEHYEAAKTIDSEVESRPELIEDLVRLSKYELIMENGKAAGAYLEEALMLAKEIDSKPYLALTYLESGKLNILDKKYDAGILNLNEAIEIYKALGQKPQLSFSYYFLASAYTKIGNKTALTILNLALEQEKSLDRKSNLASLHSLFAEYYLSENNLEKANENISKSIKTAEELKYPDLLYKNYYIQAKIYIRETKNDLAITSLKKSIENIRFMLDRVTKENRKGFMQERVEVYELLSTILFQANKTEEAQKYLEEAKEFIVRVYNRGAYKVVKINKPKVEELEVNKQEIDSLEEQVKKATSPEQAKEIGDRRKDLLDEYNKKMKALLSSGGEGKELYNNLSLNRETGTDFKKIINKETAIIEYALLKDTLYIIWLTKEAQGVKTVALTSAGLGKMIGNYRSALSANSEKGADSTKEMEKNLYASLIFPIEDFIKTKKQLIFIPYGSLYYLPFEALRNPDDSYLIEKYSISYFTRRSLGRINAGKKEVKDSTKLLLAFGNPDESLPGAEEEVLELKKILTDKANVYIKDQSSLSVFKSSAMTHFIVHLATHGILQSPADQSYFIMGKESSTNLKLDDLYQMSYETEDGNSSTQTAVLSACSTRIEFEAMGSMENAELSSIPLSLSNGFEALGVNAIIASLWEVSDEATQKLMVSFYKEMTGNGYKTGESLTEAKRKFIKEARESGKLNSPFYWSSFVLSGDWR